jgi:hypothetical protein
VEYEHIRQGANALRHMVGVLLLAWRRVVRAGGIALIVGILLTEIVGMLSTHHFPPYLLTHVVALAVGIVLAYCVALTVLVDELIKGALALVRAGLGEVEAGARAAAIIAEREVGYFGGGAAGLAGGRAGAPPPRLAAPKAAAGRPAGPVSSPLRPAARTLGQFPMPRGTTGAPAASAAGASMPPGASARLRVPPRIGETRGTMSAAGVVLPPRDETEADIAATDVFRMTAPPAPSDAHPVRADRLPRIEWAAEGLAAGAALLQSALAARAQRAAPPPSSDAPAAAMPPLPPRVTAASPAAEPAPAASPQSAPVTAPLQPVAAPSTVPLETAVPRRPFPRPSSPVRTIPVVTDDMTRAALDAADASEVGANPTVAPHVPPEAGRTHDEHAADEETSATADDDNAVWEPPSYVVVLPAGEGAATPGTSRVPDDTDAPSAEERGLWSRIGQALARSTTRPLRVRDDDGDMLDQRAP